MNLNKDTVFHVLSKRFMKEIVSANYDSKTLQGGTMGNVNLVTGTVQTEAGENLPFSMVLKTQKKWERYGDPNSWRREYDLYNSNLQTYFSDSFRWPICYHAEINTEEDEIQLWLEYVEGISGLDLTGDVYELAAKELGCFQGKLYAEQTNALSLSNLSHVDLMKNTYFHYRSWPLVYNYIRSEECEFSQHVRQMIIDIDEHADEIVAQIEKLPVVLCHRDFWVNNIIYADNTIISIDWDTSGWGYMGEDIASLISDEADIDHMVDYYKRCIPAYYKGFSEYADVPPITFNCVYEMILLIFGYRLVEWYLHAEDDEDKIKHIQTLEKVYEIKNITL